MENWRIYGLVDPRTWEIRYVGMTKHDPAGRRLYRHMRDTQGKKAAWLQKLKRTDRVPYVVIIEDDLPNRAVAARAEDQWITFGHDEGWRLTNVGRGGGGGNTPPQLLPGTIEYIKWHEAHMKGVEKRKAAGTYSHGPEARAKVGASSRGRTYGPEVRASVSVGKKSSWDRRKAEAAAAGYARIPGVPAPAHVTCSCGYTSNCASNGRRHARNRGDDHVLAYWCEVS